MSIMALHAPSSTLYVANHEGTSANPTIHQVDTNVLAIAHLKEYWSLNVSKSFDCVEVSPDGNKLLGYNNTGYLYLVDTVEDTSTSMAMSKEVNDIVFSPDGSKAYLASHLWGVYEVNMTSFTITKKIWAGFSVDRIAINPAGTRLYVANGVTGAPTVRVIDLVNDTTIDTIYLGAPYGKVADLACYPNVTVPRLYVAWAGNTGSPGNFTLIDTTTDTVKLNLPVGYNLQHLVVSPETKSVFIISSTSVDCIYKINLAGYTVDPNVIVWNSVGDIAYG